MSCTLIILKYSLTSKNIACTSPSQDQFYYDDVDSSSNLSLGDVIYTDSNCTLPAPDGWYIDFNTNPNTVFRVSGGNGIVTSIEYCTEPSPSPTPTLTLSTTPTPTPTPTPCPNNCVQYSASTISGCDLSYTNCEGDGVFTVVSAPGLLFCANSTYPITTDCTLVTIGCCPIPSVTPTPSETPSVTPSVTPSETPSVTPSVTPSLTPSVTPSVTPSLTPSETPSVTPSVTPTSNTTPSVTPSLTPSVTPSETPSVTPSVTPTSNTTPSVTPSLTPSVTPTSNTTPSVTPSLTPSITPSLTPSTTSGGPCVNDTVTPKGVKISFNSGSNYTNCDVYTGLTSTNITGVTSCTGMTTGNFCQITGITATLMEMYVRIVCEGCCEQVFRINLDECCDYTPSSPTPTPSITLSVTPSVTSSVTPSPTSNTTPSVTPSTTPSTTPSVTTSTTPSITPTITPTNTPSTSVTPTITITPTPSTTPGPSILLGRTIPDAGDSSTACSTYLSSRSYFIAPGKTLSTLVNGDIIYDSYPGTPTNGGNNWVALTVGGVGLKRAFQIDSNGVILDTFNCP